MCPSCSTHDRAYLFQNPDGRVVFAIPYEGDFTLIGTTDRDFVGDPADGDDYARGDRLPVRDGERRASRSRCARPTSCGPIAACGRSTTTAPSEAKAASRDYVLEMDETPGAPPLLAIIGGKITTYRRLAEAALERLAPHLPERHGARPPAGRARRRCRAANSSSTASTSWRRGWRATIPFLDAGHARRLARAYGREAWRVLGKATVRRGPRPAASAPR